jgi:tetratricopeptide (TPR) repeat protein
MGWSSRFAGWKGNRRASAKGADAAGNPQSKTEDAAALHPLMLEHFSGCCPARRSARRGFSLKKSHKNFCGPVYTYRKNASALRMSAILRWSSSHVAAALLLTLTATGVYGQSPPSQTLQPSRSLESAEQLLDAGHAEEAIAPLRQLAAMQPPAKGAAHALGLACYRTGKLLEARTAFEQAIRDDSTDIESVQMEGLTLYRLGQPAAAIPYLERVQQWMPHANADASYVLGLCYLNARRYDDARRAFATQYGMDPASAGAYLMLGNMLQIANLPELAADAARKAISLDRRLPLAHFLVGEVDLFKSDLDGAVAEFEQERAINPGFAAVYDRLGDTYLRSGKFQEAQASLMKALSLDISRTGPFILMGKVLLRRDDPQAAAMYLQHAEKMDPSNTMTHTLLSQTYRKLGREDDAKREIDLASKIHASTELKLQPVQ